MKKYGNKYLSYDYGGKDITIKYIIKYVLLILLEWVYKLVCSIPYKALNTKYQICFCTIFKNESPFLKEWLDYHILLGVDHFYLYNNNSEDSYMDILKPYIESNYVTLVDWPDTPGQLSAYKHWLKNYRHETTWVTFSDVDEFFCLKRETNLKLWINKHKKYPVLLVYWKVFGASSKIDHDEDKFVIEQYVSCQNKLNEVGKQFYNTNFDIDERYVNMTMHHHMEVKKCGITIPPMNVFGHFTKWKIHRTSSREIDIQQNHYNTKSLRCYAEKHKKGDSAFNSSWRSYDRFLSVEQGCTDHDYTIQRFLLMLKLKSRGINGNDLF